MRQLLSDSCELAGDCGCELARHVVFLGVLLILDAHVLALTGHEDHVQRVALAWVGVDPLQLADLVHELLVSVLGLEAVYLAEHLADEGQQHVHEHDRVENDA